MLREETVKRDGSLLGGTEVISHDGKDVGLDLVVSGEDKGILLGLLPPEFEAARLLTSCLSFNDSV